MRPARYVLRNIKYYISNIFLVCLLIFFSSFFAKEYYVLCNYSRALDNSSCRFIAYDQYSVSEDCYSYYNNSLNVYINDPDDLLNVYIYEFIDDVDYTDNSLVNQKNVYNGTYKRLGKQEVAISKESSEKYDLDVGNIIYIENKECKIIYIFNTLYEMHNYDFHTNVQSIFVGSNTIDIDSDWYCDFNPTDETHHVYLYNMNKIRSEISKKLLIRSIVVIAVSIILCWSVSLLRLKNESTMIMNSILMGNKRIKSDVLVIEMLYLLLPLILLLSLLVWNYYRYIMIALFISLFISFLVNLIVYFIYLRRSHKYE